MTPGEPLAAGYDRGPEWLPAPKGEPFRCFGCDGPVWYVRTGRRRLPVDADGHNHRFTCPAEPSAG